MQRRKRSAHVGVAGGLDVDGARELRSPFPHKGKLQDLGFLFGSDVGVFHVLQFWGRKLGLIAARQLVKEESGGLGVVAPRSELRGGALGL